MSALAHDVLRPTDAPDTAPSGAGLHVMRLSKRFGAIQALSDVAFEARPGEIVAICGPSGAGKSTLGRLISGLEQADTGSIILGARQLLALPPQQRRIAHMFESYALYPTATVVENIMSPLRSPLYRSQWSDAAMRAAVAEVMELTEITALAQRRPSELSGGQKQRVALCRTLVQKPDAYVLDEPIGHLDAKLRHKLRAEIRRRQRSLTKPTLWLTPDAIEAMAVADTVVMLVDGTVRQIGSPHDIFLRPADLSVARLVGDPAMNLIEARLDSDNDAGGPILTYDGGYFRPSPTLLQTMRQAGLRHCVLGFSPTEASLRLQPHRHAVPQDALAGQIYSVEPFGKFTLVTVDLGKSRVRLKTAADFNADIGTTAMVHLPVYRVLLFDAATGALRSESAQAIGR
jgi:multiple sugar transport system ATP-binding protein